MNNSALSKGLARHRRSAAAMSQRAFEKSFRGNPA
jgi:hypothetical protein